MTPDDIAEEILSNFSAPSGSDVRAILKSALTEAVKRGSESVNVNLKRLLMEFGNKLVGQGYDPSGPMPADLKQALQEDHSTEPITTLTTWVNAHPEAQSVLKQMGIDWPM
jgi:hypothetical protein